MKPPLLPWNMLSVTGVLLKWRNVWENNLIIVFLPNGLTILKIILIVLSGLFVPKWLTEVGGLLMIRSLMFMDGEISVKETVGNILSLSLKIRKG